MMPVAAIGRCSQVMHAAHSGPSTSQQPPLARHSNRQTVRLESNTTAALDWLWHRTGESHPDWRLPCQPAQARKAKGLEAISW